MAFINFPTPTPVFPVLPPLAWPVVKKPTFTSQVMTAVSGQQTQLTRSIIPRWEFTLSYGGESWLRDQTLNSQIDTQLAGYYELQKLSGLYLQCLGSYGEFYYSDPFDNQRNGIELGIGDGIITTFPIPVTYGDGPYYPYVFQTPVGGINSILQVYLNAVLQSSSTYGVDATNTQLVFTTAPATGDLVTINFTFYFRCRFLDDEIQFSQWALNLWEQKQIKFISVKP